MRPCVRCGDPVQMHIRADGSNIRNAACRGYLEKWPDEETPPMPVPVVTVVLPAKGGK